MHPYQKNFIDFALKYQVLRFGNFTLKSGRQSPYFFNAGLFNDGDALMQLGVFYAEAIQKANLDFDMLFGPAYKGISLAVATAIALAQRFNWNVPVAYNRKENKLHGEGGHIIGAPLKGRVMIIDDVITAGTAVRESINLIKAADASPVGLLIALDRQEKGERDISTIDELRAQSLSVTSIIKFTDLIQYLNDVKFNADITKAMILYRQQFGTENIQG